MSVTINIHKTHRQYTQGSATVAVDGRTVGECLGKLVETHPGMGEALYKSQGRLRHDIEIYVNSESAYPDELAKTVNPEDEIHILVMLAGG